MNTIVRWATTLWTATAEARARVLELCLCPRTLKGGLAIMSLIGCVQAPLIFGPTALLYLLLAIRSKR
ncbi:MAG: hypothetical protein AAF580_09730 [Pseudomonadota bacterium]